MKYSFYFFLSAIIVGVLVSFISPVISYFIFAIPVLLIAMEILKFVHKSKFAGILMWIGIAYFTNFYVGIFGYFVALFVVRVMDMRFSNTGSPSEDDFNPARLQRYGNNTVEHIYKPDSDNL